MVWSVPLFHWIALNLMLWQPPVGFWYLWDCVITTVNYLDTHHPSITTCKLLQAIPDVISGMQHHNTYTQWRYVTISIVYWHLQILAWPGISWLQHAIICPLVWNNIATCKLRLNMSWFTAAQLQLVCERIQMPLVDLVQTHISITWWL